MNETKQQAVAVKVEDRFKAPRPAYTAPDNGGVTMPQPKDNRPALSLREQAKQSGDDKLAALFAKAEENARKSLDRAQGKVVESKPRVTKSRKQKEQTTPIIPAQFKPEDVFDDVTFLKRTISGDYHSPEMKALFWANGGEKFLKAGLSYASAFSNLRREKQNAISAKK